MNYMKQVAQLLGVELGEEFGIVNGYYKYRITELGVEYYNELDKRWTECNYKMAWLLNGSYEIIKLPKPILDDVEKEYLSNIITPFIDKITYIRKNTYSSNTEYIDIGYCESNKVEYDIEFPLFKKGAMYKGMEANKSYTLEDLGL